MTDWMVAIVRTTLFIVVTIIGVGIEVCASLHPFACLSEARLLTPRLRSAVCIDLCGVTHLFHPSTQ